MQNLIPYKNSIQYGEEALLEFFQHANSAHPNIRFTYTFGKMVDYLDATLGINGQSITSDLFTKPTDTHQYLLPSSDHPAHVHRHLPFGLGMRLRAIVSDDAKLEDRLAELTGFLKARGYSEDVIKSQLTKVQSIPRSQILSSSRRHTNDNNWIPLVCRWNSHLPPLDKLLRESFPILQSNPHLRNTFDLPLVAYKRPRNLRDLLTSRPRADPIGPSKDRPNGTFPCEVARCKTCEVVRNIEAFRYKTNNTHLVQEHFTCASTSVVYLISCGHPKCNAAYVGETGCTLRERMNGHRLAVKNKTDMPVANHFSTREHSLKISVLQAAPTAVVQCRLLEKLWIERIEESPQYRLLNRDEGLDIRTL